MQHPPICRLRQFTVLVLLTLLFGGAVACGPADRYFRDISYGPQLNIVGQMEVSAADAQKGRAYRVEYAAENQPKQITFLFNGKEGFHGSELSAAVVKFEYPEDGSVIHTFLDVDGEPATAVHGGIYRRRVAVEGDTMTITFIDETGATVEDNSGSTGNERSITRDENGRITVTRSIASEDATGNIAGDEVHWNERGLAAEVRFFDQAGKPALNNAGWARAEFKYDERGALTESRYFDKQDRPVQGMHCGPVERRTVNDLGQVTERRCLTADGKPSAKGTTISRYSYELKDDHYEVTVEYLNAEEKPVTDDVTRTVYRTDRTLYPVETRNYGADGKLRDRSYAGAVQIVKRDKYGRPLEERQLDQNEKPFTVGLLNFSIERNHYEGARLVRREFFDANDKPVIHGYYNYAAMEIKVEDDGTEYIIFFDTKGKQLEKRKL